MAAAAEAAVVVVVILAGSAQSLILFIYDTLKNFCCLFCCLVPTLLVHIVGLKAMRMLLSLLIFSPFSLNFSNTNFLFQL